jgi:hypothetical protein
MLGYSRPPVWNYDQQGGIQISSLWEELLKCRLVNSGFDEADVMEKHLPLAWYDYFTLQEMRQASECSQPEQWRKIFFTAKDAEMLNLK